MAARAAYKATPPFKAGLRIVGVVRRHSADHPAQKGTSSTATTSPASLLK